MRIAVINVDCAAGGSTGRIAVEIIQEQNYENNEIFFAYGREGKVIENIHSYLVSSKGAVYLHVLLTRVFDIHGFGSFCATKKLIRELERFKPDVLWIHNIHGYYINIKVLFEWLKKQTSLKVYWLLHDCWAFTGHCAYFTAARCEKWKTGCFECPQKKEYPASLFLDNSKWNYAKKRELFTNVKSLTIVTPSNWLADLVKQSFLSGYPVEVRHNPIDHSVFRPMKSDIRKRYCLEGKTVVLGVANIWNKRKGLDDFAKLRERLEERFVIVLVGLTKEQIDNLPAGIIGLTRTESVEELVKLYSASDVLFNPTYEDNYPTVNLEAEACGIPVITYNTGGCSETIRNEKSKVIATGDLSEAAKYIEAL